MVLGDAARVREELGRDPAQATRVDADSGRSPDPDWIATIQTLIDAGASTRTISLSPDDPKAPSPEVAQLLRERGIGDEQPDGPHS